jgi:4'-phosphopantetheinyl transferase
MRVRPSPELLGKDVHVWTQQIRASEAALAVLERVLSDEEADRATRFRNRQLRKSFVITRGSLRHLLGSYLEVDPASIRLVTGAYGKPALASPAAIEFNVTHSDGLAAFALTAGCPVGIDLERIRPLASMEEIAYRFFSGEEATDLQSLPARERERAFFCCWTRKEAYVKAIGKGLCEALEHFRVTVLPNQPPRIVHLGYDTTNPQAWTLHDLTLAADYAGAIAYKDRPRSLSIFPVADPTEFPFALPQHRVT